MINLKEIPKTAGIYKFTNKINGKIYIGKSIHLYSRIVQHKNYPKKTKKQRFHLALQKYGWNNFQLELFELPDFSDKILLFLETCLIYEFNTINKELGYNLVIYSNSLLGRKHSKETKLKIKNAAKRRKLNGYVSPLIGHKSSKETCLKISLSNKGKKRSQQTKERLSFCKMGDKNPNKKWKAYGNPTFDKTIHKFQHRITGEIFEGYQYDFYTKYNLRNTNISRIISGRDKSFKNWIYLGKVTPNQTN